jgi:hypothetical protein
LGRMNGALGLLRSAHERAGSMGEGRRWGGDC